MFVLPSFGPIVYPAPASSGETLWTPAQVSPWAWWDFGDVNNTTIVSGAFSATADRSGNGRNIIQGTVASRPTTITINGITAANFTSAQFMQIASGLTTAWESYHIFATFNYTGALSTSAANRIIVFAGASTTDTAANGFSIARASNASNIGSFNAGATLRSATGFDLGAWGIVSAFHDGSQSGISINANAEALEANTFGTKNPVRLGVGRPIGFANGNWIGQLAEIVVFQSSKISTLPNECRGI